MICICRLHVGFTKGLSLRVCNNFQYLFTQPMLGDLEQFGERVLNDLWKAFSEEVHRLISNMCAGRKKNNNF